MPIENELKYVLKSSIEDDLAQLEEADFYNITQAYLPSVDDIQLRLRSIAKNDKIKRVFTIKSKNVDGTNTEIEHSLEEDDFNELLKKASKFVTKIRWNYKGWEIDVFKNNNEESYFWMAEIEMPPGQKAPESIPKIISKHLLFSVALTDNRFSSKKISDITYATKLLKHLKKLKEEKQ